MVRIKLVALLLSLLIPSSGVISQDDFKNVVIFYGDNESRPAYSRIADGIKSSFPEGYGSGINLISEYLDLERFADSSRLQQVVDMYNNRVKASSIDLVITVAPGAYDALREFGLKLLHNKPVVALEMSPQDSDRYLPGTRVVEFQLEWSPKNSMAHAFSLFPERRSAYVIGGCSESDRMYSARIQKDADYFKDTHHFTFLSCVSIDSVLEVVRHLPDHSMVFLASFATDVNNTPFSTTLALPVISRQSRVPVFTMSDNFINYGGIGGHVISFTEVGTEAGKIALDLMKYDTLKGFTKIVKACNRFQYNWEELKKWDLLDSKAIPAGSTYFFREVNFLREYRWQIIGVLMLIFLQTFLITYMIRLVRNQKKVVVQKVLNEQLYRQLLWQERVTTMALLTASLSHELNQPLTAILFNTQAGLRFLQSGRLDDPQAKSILTDIEEDVKRASGIISSIRSMMKLEARQREPIDLSILTKDVLQILQSELKQNQVQVIFEYPEYDLKVFGNRIELQQVIINVLLNAVKAMKNNSPEQKMLIIKLKDLNGLVTMVIADNGPGIPEDLKEKLFDPFTTSRPEGMGIGLALCKSIIAQHNGEIHAENRPEGGAKFSFTLPVFNP